MKTYKLQIVELNENNEFELYDTMMTLQNVVFIPDDPRIYALCEVIV